MCWWCSSISIRSADSSGRTSASASPVATKSSSAARGESCSSVFDSSTWTRSGVIRASSPDIAVMASTTSSTGVSPSWATKRTARSIRSGSSAKESAADPGVRSRRGEQVAQPAEGVGHRAVGAQRDRHRVHGEVAADQVVDERGTPRHLGVARLPVVAVRPEGGDLQADAAHLGAHGAEGDPRVPRGTRPPVQQFEHLLRPGVGGDVEVAGQVGRSCPGAPRPAARRAPNPRRDGPRSPPW